MAEPKAYEAVTAKRAIGAASKLYSEADCSYLVLVLIPRNEV